MSKDHFAYQLKANPNLKTINGFLAGLCSDLYSLNPESEAVRKLLDEMRHEALQDALETIRHPAQIVATSFDKPQAGTFLKILLDCLDPETTDISTHGRLIAVDALLYGVALRQFLDVDTIMTDIFTFMRKEVAGSPEHLKSFHAILYRHFSFPDMEFGSNVFVPRHDPVGEFAKKDPAIYSKVSPVENYLSELGSLMAKQTAKGDFTTYLSQAIREMRRLLPSSSAAEACRPEATVAALRAIGVGL